MLLEMAVKTSAIRVSWRRGNRRRDSAPSTDEGMTRLRKAESPLKAVGMTSHAFVRTFRASMSKNAPAFVPSDVPDDARIAIVAARFNAEIVDELLAGCQRRLKGL
jgi:hypothetical protein